MISDSLFNKKVYHNDYHLEYILEKIDLKKVVFQRNLIELSFHHFR